MRAVFYVTLVAVLIVSLLPGNAGLPSTGWDKTNHVLAFAVLGALGAWAYPRHTVRMVLFLMAYGGAIEVVQSLTPYRFAEWSDLLADCLGVALGWMSGMISLWAARRFRSLRGISARVRNGMDRTD